MEGIPLIDHPTELERELIFRAIVRAIETNSGIGFGRGNSDQGHLAYVAGSNGDVGGQWGDSPEENILFQLLCSFDEEYHREIQDLSTWERFCSFAVEAYNRENPNMR